MNSLNTILAIICFFWGLIEVIRGVYYAPTWLQMVLFGLFLFALSRQFISNTTRTKPRK